MSSAMISKILQNRFSDARFPFYGNRPHVRALASISHFSFKFLISHCSFLISHCSFLIFISCSSLPDGLFGKKEPAVVVSPLAEELGFSKDRPLVMGMNTSYEPLQFVDEHGAPSGYDVEFTKILMRRLGIPFAFSPNHWDQMSPGIIGGKYDMGMLVYSPYRKDLTNYSNAVFRLYYQIVYRSKDYSDFDFRHLKGKKIAYMKSRPIGLMLKEEGADDHPITDLSEAFTDLANGEYDGLICYRFQVKYEIEHLGLNKLLKADDLSLEQREYCYASHDPRLIAAINSQLKSMEAEGIIDQVYGDEVISQFDAIEIPAWVWLLLVFLTFIFLVVFSLNRYLLSRRLQQAYDQMAEKNSALVVANERAEESTRMKSDFIKQISHEIRTPLNILSGFTQLITSPSTELSDSEKSEAGQRIMESTDRITGLVNKMLELADVSSNAVLERNDETTPMQIAELAIADAPHLTFELKCEDGADMPFMTHRRSATRILELLLDNAIKFTHSAEPFMQQTAGTKKEHVTLTVGRADGHVRFIVDDTGISIPAAEAEHIFDEFVQLDEYYDGTGIGLTVARSLARRLGGDVQFDSSYTAATRFVITLLT